MHAPGMLIERRPLTCGGSVDHAPALRELGRSDAAGLTGLVARCSERSLRDRFFGYTATPVPALTDQLLRSAALRCAFGAFLGDELVGMANALPAGDECWEGAVLVADGWQHVGVGRGLVELVVGRARESGVSVMAYVQYGNGRALGLARGLQRAYPETVRFSVVP